MESMKLTSFTVLINRRLVLISKCPFDVDGCVDSKSRVKCQLTFFSKPSLF